LLIIRKISERRLNHIVLSGLLGLGRMTSAMILAVKIRANIYVTSAPVVEKTGDLAGMLTGLDYGDGIFMDEIHCLSKTVEEYFCSTMEDYGIDAMVDQEPMRAVSVSTFRNGH
jgi:Holliday junction DNA helicase RuvB